MKTLAKYLFAVIIGIFVWSLIWPTSASVIADRSFRIGNTISESEKLNPKDTIVGDTTKLKYPIKDFSNNPYQRQNNPFNLKNPSNMNSDLEYDAKSKEFIFYQRVGDLNIRAPYIMPYNEYKKYEMNSALRNYWMERSSFEGNKEGNQGNKLLDKYLSPRLNVPIVGFDRIFGSNTINIKPQGSAELIFGINISRIENPTLPLNLQRSTNFDFDEKIQMGVTGQIGDKMKLGINYNTEATFDFENQTTIAYTGNEDEIIQSIEAGNVSLPLSGSLITGSHSLFGIKTALKFGKLTITSVASQQKGESSVIEIQGGAQTSNYKFSASEYEANKHFFVSQYFRDNYENALQSLPIITSAINITRIEIWVTNKSGNFEQSRNIVAFTDLAEAEKNIYSKPLLYQTTPGAIPFNEINNLYQLLTVTYSGIRDINQVTGTLSPLAPKFIAARDFEKVENARKLSPSEYTLNPKLGFISLNTALNADEVLGVAYEYMINGQLYQVGEFATGGVSAPQSLIVKLLKPTASVPSLPCWKLMMKNVYSIGAYQINSDNFTLNVLYQNDKTGTAVNYLSEGKIKDQLLIQVMNMDRVNSQLDPYPDGVFDFIDKITINASNGRIFFPVLEPFGSFLKNKIADDAISQKYVFQELYDSTQSQAQQIAEKNKFMIEGTYRSSGGSEINLNAMNIPEGSVKVSAGGMQLVEGNDYLVDYTLGRVTILNHGLLESNTPIQISLENNSLFNIGTKNLFGSHFNYQFSDRFNLGGTVMHLTEKPLTSKVNIGDEPISNTIWGFDGNYSTDAPFLTRFVDWLPLIQTKEMSTINITGEFAQLIPGHSKAIDKAGTSYIDDFEGSKTTIDIKSPIAWVLSSTPQGQPNLFKEGDLHDNLAYGANRAKLAWYNIISDFLRNNSATPSNITKDDQSNHYVREIFEQEIFPNKESQSGIPQVLSVLNLAFYPLEKGPYNFDIKGFPGISSGMDENGFLKNPASRWGGVMRKIQTNDFEAANVEFIEFWMMDPFVYDSLSTGGDLYFNLGNISEDVLKDSRKSFENGLPSTENVELVDSTVWGRVPLKQSLVNAFDNNPQSREYQDVGLDGLSNKDELTFFKNYLDSIAGNYGINSKAYQTSLSDPSNDNYHFFRGGDYDADQVSILGRYKKYNGLEGNSPTANQSPESYPTSATLMPDIEDINLDNTLSETESYFQYKVHLSPTDMQVGKNYITNIQVGDWELRNGNRANVKWYQFKIPIHEPDEAIGSIRDFKSIRFVRMFMKGFQKDVILRFAKLDLVRGEWRKYTFGLSEGSEAITTPQLGDASFDISAVNIEENGTRTPVNYVLPPGLSRVIDPSNPQMRQLNEQSIVLKVNNLDDGDARAAYRNVEMDVRQYKRLKMNIHAEAIEGYSLRDNELTVFVRVGSDYKQNYYEYEIPIKLTQAGLYSNESEDDRRIVWPDENLFDIDFEVFQAVKQERNNQMRQGGSTITLSSPYVVYDGKNKVSVCGNPNLSNIRTIMIGVRNPNRKNNSSQDDGAPKSAELWFNELRLTDFNENGGWAANARIAAKLADFANLTLAGSTSKSGFGSIEKKVNERQKEDIYQYDISSNVELGKVFPQKYGVRVPMYFSISERFSNPQYNPLDPDIELKTTLKSPYLSSSEKDSIKRISQDYTRRKSINFTNVQIRGSNKSDGVARFYSISNWSTSYSFSEVFSRNINTEYNLLKNYSGSVNYVYNNTPKNVIPFRKVKFLKSNLFLVIRDFNFYYAPSMVSFRTEMSRMYNEIQMRNISNPNLMIPATFKKDFIWNRTFDLKYNLAKSLRLDFSSNNMARIDEPQGRISKADEDYRDKRDTILQNIYNLGRTTQYHHTLEANWNVPINKIPGFAWTSLTARYQATYDWNTGPILSDTSRFKPGNTIKNSANTQLSGQLNFDRLYTKVSYIKKVNDRFTQKGRIPAKREFKDVIFKKENIRFTAGISKSISHKLMVENVNVKVFDKDGNEVKVKTEIINSSKVKITTEQDVRGATVEVSGKKQKVENLLIVVSDYMIKALTGVKNVSITYTSTNGTMLPGYLPSVTVFGVENYNNMYSPGLDFIMGSQRNNFAQKASQNSWLTSDTTLNSAFNMAKTITWSIRSTIEPINNFRIEVTANRNYSNNMNEYWRIQNNSYRTQNKMFTGNFSMSYNMVRTSMWKIGKTDYSSKAYEAFSSNRIIIAQRLASERKSANRSGGIIYNPNAPNLDPKTGLAIQNGFPNGYSPLSQDVLIPSFLAAYANKPVDKISLKTFPTLPLPNWRITYDGLSNLPGLNKILRTVTINHSYRATYNVGSYSSNAAFSFDQQATDGFSYVRDKVNALFIPENEAGGVTLEEAYAPFIGIDISWLGNLSTRLEYKRMRNYSLSFANNQLVETYDNEFVIGAAYKLAQLPIVIRTNGKQKKFQSDLNIRADFSIRNAMTIFRKIEEDVTQLTAGKRNISIKASADYVLSERFNLRLFYDQTINAPKVSTEFRTSNAKFGISIRFTLIP